MMSRPPVQGHPEGEGQKTSYSHFAVAAAADDDPFDGFADRRETNAVADASC